MHFRLDNFFFREINLTKNLKVEGAWNEDGKGQSIWDVFSNDPTNGNIVNGDNGRVACDSYHKYKEDVQVFSKKNS